MRTFTILLLTTLLPLAAVAQFHGDIDSSFGTNGYVVYDLLKDNTYDVVRQAHFGPDGKLYIAGVLAKNPQRIFMTRMHTDGRIDSTFGNNGLSVFNPSIGAPDGVYDMALAPGGKLVLAGYAGPAPNQHMVARFLDDGNLDYSFANTGFIIAGNQYEDKLYTCMVEGSGKIVVAGMLGDNPGNNLFVARYLENGQDDLNFGTGGIVVLDFATYESIRAITSAGLNRYYLLARIGAKQEVIALNNVGQLIGTFGDNGRSKLPEAQGIPTMVGMGVMPNGKLLLYGYNETAPGVIDAIVMMMNQDGTLDSTFGVGGIFRADLGHGHGDGVTGVHLLMDASLLFSGLRETPAGGTRFTTFMLASDGSLISGYGVNGVKEYNLTGSLHEDYGKLAVHPDGQNGTVYLVGSSSFQTGYDLVVMRLLTKEPVTTGLAAQLPLPVIAYPNPLIPGAPLSLQVGNMPDGPLHLEAFNISGQEVFTQTVHTAPGTLQISMPQLPAGMYILKGIHHMGAFTIPLQVLR